MRERSNNDTCTASVQVIGTNVDESGRQTNRLEESVEQRKNKRE